MIGLPHRNEVVWYQSKRKGMQITPPKDRCPTDVFYQLYWQYEYRDNETWTLPSRSSLSLILFLSCRSGEILSVHSPTGDQAWPFIPQGTVRWTNLGQMQFFPRPFWLVHSLERFFWDIYTAFDCRRKHEALQTVFEPLVQLWLKQTQSFSIWSKLELGFCCSQPKEFHLLQS